MANTEYLGKAMAITRFGLAFVFLWAFFDKLLGLGFSTCRDKVSGAYLGLMCDKAWLVAGSPTKGFLSGIKAEVNPLAWFFNGLAGHPVVNTLFMLGLLGIGIALLFGAGLRIAAVAGGLLLMMMWVAKWGTFTSNPFMDDHVMYTFVLFVLMFGDAGDTWGLGQWWKNTEIVKKYPWLA